MGKVFSQSGGVGGGSGGVFQHSVLQVCGEGARDDLGIDCDDSIREILLRCDMSIGDNTEFCKLGDTSEGSCSQGVHAFARDEGAEDMQVEYIGSSDCIGGDMGFGGGIDDFTDFDYRQGDSRMVAWSDGFSDCANFSGHRQGENLVQLDMSIWYDI